MQPSTTRATSINNRPLTGKLHPKDFTNDPTSDASSFLLNTLNGGLPQQSGRNLKFGGTQNGLLNQNGDLVSKHGAQKQGTRNRYQQQSNTAGTAGAS